MYQLVFLLSKSLGWCKKLLVNLQTYDLPMWKFSNSPSQITKIYRGPKEKIFIIPEESIQQLHALSDGYDHLIQQKI